MSKKKPTAEDVLREFCDDVDAAGGITYDRKGQAVLDQDDDWPDLADTYIKACTVLGRLYRTPDGDDV